MNSLMLVHCLSNTTYRIRPIGFPIVFLICMAADPCTKPSGKKRPDKPCLARPACLLGAGLWSYSEGSCKTNDIACSATCKSCTLTM